MFKDKWPWLLLAVAVFISSLYEYGYWTVFHFKAFEYFTIDSLIKNFAYVIISGFKLNSLLPLTGLLPQLVEQFQVEPNPGRKNRLQQFKEKYPRIAVTIEGLVGLGMIALILILASRHPGYDSALYTLTFSFIALFAALEDRFNSLGSPVLRLWATYYFLSYSLTALETGQRDALAIIRNEKPSLVTFSEAEQKEIGCQQAKFIGVLGDSYVLLTPNNQQVFLVLKEHLPTLRLDRARRTMGLPRH